MIKLIHKKLMQKNRIKYSKEYEEIIAAKTTVDNNWIDKKVVWADQH